MINSTTHSLGLHIFECILGTMELCKCRQGIEQSPDFVNLGFTSKIPSQRFLSKVSSECRVVSERQDSRSQKQFRVET